MPNDFTQLQWNTQLADDCHNLIRMALKEDIGNLFDLTTRVLIPGGQAGRARVVARQPGTICGLMAGQEALQQVDPNAHWQPCAEDGQEVEPGTVLAELTGRAGSLLTAERVVLNLIGRLSGIATLTHQFVDQTRGTGARIYDTRKTTPGWRRLEKYAVRQGGGCNHRTGLFDAVLIKDNHLAMVARSANGPLTPAAAVRQARLRVKQLLGEAAGSIVIEIEVDTLEQLREVLVERPDIVLLDNMNNDELRAAVALRDPQQKDTQLEASGGVTLTTVRSIAQTGVDRISVGALTHSAQSLDVAVDWVGAQKKT